MRRAAPVRLEVRPTPARRDGSSRDGRCFEKERARDRRAEKPPCVVVEMSGSEADADAETSKHLQQRHEMKLVRVRRMRRGSGRAKNTPMQTDER